MTLSTKEQAVQLIDSAFEAAMNDQHAGFAWELFWEFGIHSKLQDYNVKLLSEALKVDNGKGFDIAKMIDCESSEVLDAIKERKTVLMKQHGIKQVKFAAYRDRIVTFFKDHRDIDFDSLDEEGAKLALRTEDIMGSSYGIYDALGITHMQYKYLHQRGGVQLKN